VQIKTPARELPATHDLPLSGWSSSEPARLARQSGLLATLGDSTVWGRLPSPKQYVSELMNRGS
jgi:hypothetical protein